MSKGRETSNESSSASFLCCTGQPPPSSCGEKGGSGPLEELGGPANPDGSQAPASLPSSAPASCLPPPVHWHRHASTPQQTRLLQQCLHFQAPCTPKLPAAQCTLHPMCSAPQCTLHPCALHPHATCIPCTPICPSPPHPSSPPSPSLLESWGPQAPKTELGGGQGGISVRLPGSGLPLDAPVKHVLDDKAVSACPHAPCTLLPASARSLPAPCFCLHTLGFLKKCLTLHQALT